MFMIYFLPFQSITIGIFQCVCMCVCEWEYLCGGDFRVSFVFVFLAAQLGRCSCMAATYRATSQKQPYKCYCAHLIDLSQAQGRPDRLTLERNGREWLVNKQASQCLQQRRLGRRWRGGTLGLAH